MKQVRRPSWKRGAPDLSYQGNEKKYKMSITEVHGGGSRLPGKELIGRNAGVG